MNSKVQLVFFLVNFLGAYGSTKSSVLYKAKPGAVSNSRTIACAADMAKSEFIGMRIKDSTGDCESLTWESGINPENDGVYSYYEKITSEEIFNPSLPIVGTYQWLLPAKFVEGGKLEFFITVTAEQTAFYLQLMDFTGTTYNLYSGVDGNENIMVYMQAHANADYVVYKSWYPNTWWVNRGAPAFVFPEGVPFNLTIVPGPGNQLQILLDDQVAMTYENLADHEEAKQVLFSTGEPNALKINSIRLFGV